jgi:hypothetical protein
LEVVRTIQMTDTYIEAQRELGFTEGLFTGRGTVWQFSIHA